MLPDQIPQIISRLKNDFRFKETGKHLRAGVCPECQHKTLWTWLEAPASIQCDRTNNCNYQATYKELYPDLLENLSKRYQQTKEEPNRTADIYLSQVRGLPLEKIKGWYEQSKYWHPHADKGSATVRFYLKEDKSAYWERLIDNVVLTHEDGKKEVRNKNFKGSFQGLWWHQPGLNIKPKDKVYLVEGILDAIALNMNGFKAVSIMSSGTFPSESIKPYLGQEVRWVFALDNDTAGINAINKHLEQLESLGEKGFAAVSSLDKSVKLDWNDLHQAKKLSTRDMARYEQMGSVIIAKTHYKKAYYLFLLYDRKPFFVFNFKQTTYSFRIDVKRENDDTFVHDEEDFNRKSMIKAIATFSLNFLYFQQPENGDDGQYFFRLLFANKAKGLNMAFSRSALAKASNFKESAMREPGAHWSGDTKDLDYLYKQWMDNIPKRVRTIDYIGYDKSVKAYIFNDYAIENGKIIARNKEDFFPLKDMGIKSIVEGKQKLSLNPHREFLTDYETAYGIGGIVALAWWLGSLFAEQIRAEFSSYPFFEIVGDSGSGKSQMVDVLSKLIGKDSDVFNPNFGTATGRMRKLSAISNMPVCFNETDNENEKSHVKRFSWDEMKDLYEGRIGRVVGVKTNDNSIKEPVFKGSLMIIQNLPVYASEAILSRIIHLRFDRTHHSYKGKQAADRLMQYDITELSGFLLNTLQKETAIISQFRTQYKAHGEELRKLGSIKTQRIMDNHAMLLALVDCLPIALPEISIQTVKEAVIKTKFMAEERESVLKRDHPVVEQFWAIYDYLNIKISGEGYAGGAVEKECLNHSGNQGEIAINLEHFRKFCVTNNQETIETKLLRQYLPGSTSPKFVACNVAIWSVIESKTMRCFVFKV